LTVKKKSWHGKAKVLRHLSSTDGFRGNYDHHFARVAFPGEELDAYAREGFTRLKAEQARLLRHR
jgi:hypothetical protein